LLVPIILSFLKFGLERRAGAEWAAWGRARAALVRGLRKSGSEVSTTHNKGELSQVVSLCAEHGEICACKN
jgi:hypothetical protein